MQNSRAHGKSSYLKKAKPTPVPRILVRQTPSNEPPIADIPKPTPPTPQQSIRKPSTAPASEQHKDIRGISVPVISPTGKLLGNSVRRSLSFLRVRASIGVLGRSSILNRHIISLFADRCRQANEDEFRGIDVWVTSTRMLLIDTPPLFASSIADKWRRESSLSRHSAMRVYSLQIALWMLQVCDTLLVTVDNGKFDQDIASILAQACKLVSDIPGLSMPAAPDDFAALAKCRLHLVVLKSPASSLDALQENEERCRLARLYQDATGICVSGVTFLQSSSGSEQNGIASAMDVAKSWSAVPHRPLYPWMDSTEESRDSSILGCNKAGRQSRGNFAILEESMGELRDQVLVPGSANLWRNDESEGKWVSHCTRAWDSIRRSDQLQRLATTRSHIPK
ncbi:smg-9, nonsense mediated mRNA decay factor [Coemansia brasiliensis]|uniref:Smg-9, nonsense mediated mRNA decay factor n=1 Tax=Coemansia brasiliensis TaxID=2650707 RepID=A0A9W8IAM6_9FUNG|nr:smg-9, nonsense mediated mRNA decay factor [Coemansia brasiliensis]